MKNIKTSKPRILHIAPANISGVPGQFVRTERQLGYDSRLVTLFQDPRNYFSDICLNLPFIDFKLTKWIKKIVSDPSKLAVLNKTRQPESIPIVWRPHSLMERILVDARDRIWQPIITRAIKKYHLDEFDVYQLDGGLGFYRHASFITRMKERGKKIICCYTGSDVIVSILETLKQHSDIQIELIEGLPYQEAIARKRNCDIFVDQIGDLGYGINSLEAMAMGIPAASCLAPGFEEMAPQHALIAVNADNLAEKIFPLIQNAALRRAAGERGRAWVAKYHDAVSVVQKIHELAGLI